jgi:hypothetical protein
MREIFVTNTNDFHHSDRFNGQEYEFPPKERVAISTDAASHLFGFNMPDKTETLTRLGWASRFNPKIKNWEDDPRGVEKLRRFVFTKAVMVEAPVEEVAAEAEEGQDDRAS